MGLIYVTYRIEDAKGPEDRPAPSPFPSSKIMKLCDMHGVRSAEEFPVELCRDEGTGRLLVRGINEGGFACVDIDLVDLVRWLGLNPDAVGFALSVTEHSR